MQAIVFQGHAFPEDFFDPEEGLIWSDRRWEQRLDKGTAQRRFRDARFFIGNALKNLAERQQARATFRHLLQPLAGLLGWRLGDKPEHVETTEGEEEIGYPVFVDGDEPLLFVRALAPDASFDSPPEGHHRRFAPTLVMERALREKAHNFGILLNGTSLRLLHFESGMRSWVEIDLTAIGDGTRDGERAWVLLWALLRSDALRRKNLHDAVKEAQSHAQKVGEDLGRQVQDAIKTLISAVINHPENAPIKDQLLSELPKFYEQTLRFLYRLLFILYAEARGLLPLDSPLYRDGYSLDRWAKWAFENRSRLTDSDCFLEATIKALFQLMWEGADLGHLGKIPAYKGNLFDPEATSLLNSARIGDRSLAEVLIRLTYRQTPQGWHRVSYRNLAVEHIGSVYETLLEFQPEVAKETMWEVQVNGRAEFLNREQMREVLSRRPCENPEKLEDSELESIARRSQSRGRSQKTLQVKQKLQPNDVFLRAGFRRKQTGTYFTHPALVNFLVRKTLEPLVEGKSPEELLQIKVVDPAMGSGHFLVAACRFLAEKLLAGYKQRFNEVQRENPDLPESEIFQIAQIPKQVARVWNDDERALAACKLLVANHCLYGVDKNPLAVDLAKVTLWIETAASDQPLTFLDHRFKVGDSLLGIPLKRLLPKGLFADLLRAKLREAFRHLERISDLISDDPANLDGLRIAHQAMEEALQPFWQLHQIAIGAELSKERGRNKSEDNLWRGELSAGNLEGALKLGEHLRLIGEENRAFSWELAFPDVFFEPDGTPKENAGFDALLGNPPWDKVQAERHQFYADYDPLIGDYQGQSLERRIQELHQRDPSIAEQWAKWSALIEAYKNFLTKSGVYRHQFATLCNSCNALLPEVHCKQCDAQTPMDEKCAFCGATLFGRSKPMPCPKCGADLKAKNALNKTTGREDLYRFFAERAWQLVKNGGFVGFLLPAAFYSTEGATALRRLLLDKSKLTACFSFENRRRLFPIDIRYKFATVVWQKGKETDEFPAAFMLHDPEFLDLPETSPERLRRQVNLTTAFIERTSPGYRLFLEVKNELERRLADRLHQKFPRLGEKVESAPWNVTGFKQELNMTQDAYLFRTAEQLERNLAQRVEPDPRNRQGGIYYRTPDEATYSQFGYRVVHVPHYEVKVALPQDALPTMSAEEIERKLQAELEKEEEEKQERRRRRPWESRRPRKESLLREVLTRSFVCSDEYVPLYEGKMVHQFDPAAKAYVSGEGHRQTWRPLGWHEKHLVPHFFVSRKLFTALLPEQVRFRAGFMNVARATDERTVQTAVIAPSAVCGNSLPTLSFSPEKPALPILWGSLANSFVVDCIARRKVLINLNFFLVSQLPMPRLSPDDGLGRELVVLAARLNCVIPELAELWEEVAKHYPEAMHPQWQLPHPDLPTCPSAQLPTCDPSERQFLRARIDALVADAYGLSVQEFAYILSTFPLLDRNAPPLPMRRSEIGNPNAETEPKSTVTRDLALFAFMLHKGWQPSPFGQSNPDFHRWLCEKLSASVHEGKRASESDELPQIPADLAEWFAREVPEAQIPEMGEIRDLEERLFVALKQLNATAYIPTQREGEEETEEEGEDETAEDGE
jgi:hypothetical protein